MFLSINAIKCCEGLDRQDLPRYRALTVVAKAADGHIAQLVEQLTLNQRVVGSIPTVPTISFETRAAWPFFLAQKQAQACPKPSKGDFHERSSY